MPLTLMTSRCLWHFAKTMEERSPRRARKIPTRLTRWPLQPGSSQGLEPGPDITASQHQPHWHAASNDITPSNMEGKSQRELCESDSRDCWGLPYKKQYSLVDVPPGALPKSPVRHLDRHSESGETSWHAGSRRGAGASDWWTA